MDDVKRLLLQNQREKLVSDLQVEVILPDLYHHKVLEDDDIENINHQRTQKDRVRCLLDILIKQSNDAYEKFTNVLEKHYDWLAKDLKLPSGSTECCPYDDRIYYDTITLGDVPHFPPHYVIRTSNLEILRNRLQNLKRGKYVVLHGMTGSGKSCLAAAAISDRTLLNQYFKNKIFWINVGDIQSDNDIVQHLFRLYQKLDFNKNSKTLKRQSINMADGVHCAKNVLRHAFTDDLIREGLLILDDVPSKKVIESFDFGCKILVTTRDMKVVPSGQTDFIEVKGGFTEHETLTLFSKCLNLPIEKLPLQAKKIHTLCKGGPMLIALIGSLLEQCREDVISNEKRWNYFIDKLTKKEYKFKNEQLFGAIKMCIDNLSDELRNYYKHFALFVEDVNIMPEVLQTIWHEDKYKVEDILIDLKNKSLVVSVFNKHFQSYVYGIHDLLLAYLKKQLTKEEKIKLHQHFISSYRKLCNNNFANLPNDNYIFSYIGYHLYEGELWSEFSIIYLDLNFIGAKIKAVGPADLIADFKRYKHLITNNNPVLVNKLKEIENFVMENGQDLQKYQITDVIQYALQQPKSSEIYKKALEIAISNKTQMYFHVSFKEESIYYKSTLDLPQEVTVACFTNDVNRVLIGTILGENQNQTFQIQLWDQSYKNQLYTFHGHTGNITSLRLHSSGREFLSTSEDGTVKIWSLEGVPCVNSNGNIFDENGFNDKTPSPRIRQPNWSDFYENTDTTDRSKLTLRTIENLICAAYPHNEYDKRVVVGSNNGSIILFSSVDGCEIDSLNTGLEIEINSITFSLDDKLILFSCENFIHFYSSCQFKFINKFDNVCRSTLLVIVPTIYNKIVAVCADVINIWSWSIEESVSDVIVSCPNILKLNGCTDAHYICGTVTVDGKYVIAAASNYTIRIWEISTGAFVKEIFDHNGWTLCLDTYLLENSENTVCCYQLLSTTDDKAIKQWYIHPVDLKFIHPVKLREPYSAYFYEKVPQIASIDVNNKIKVYHGLTLTLDLEAPGTEIKALTFCSMFKKLAYGCSKGLIKEFDLITKTDKLIMKLHAPISYLEYFNNILVAAAENGSLITSDTNKIQLLNGNGHSRNTEITSIQNCRIIKCFLLKFDKYLLSVAKDRSIKCWNLNNGSFDVLTGSFTDDVTMATVTADNDRLAVTESNGFFYVYGITVKKESDENILSAQFSQSSKCDSSLRSCCFSPNGKILALGQDNGKIVLWSLEYKETLSILNLHHSYVRHLSFSPSSFPLVLVSLGEQIAWWNISYVQQQEESKLKRRSRGSGRFKSTNNGLKSDLTLDNLHIIPDNTNAQLINNAWNSVKGHKSKPELFACIKLKGTYATQLFWSKDFSTFTTIDDYGLIYIINMLQAH